MSHHLHINDPLTFRKALLDLDPVMRPVAVEDENRAEIESFISSAYKNMFNAKLNSFLPNLVASTLAHDNIYAAFGYCDAAQSPLFLESYLEVSIEKALSQKLGYPIERHQIVEVGNLSISKCADSVKTMRDIASYLRNLGYEWIVCTATRYLRLLFLKSGSRPTSIAQAPNSKVINDGTDWGNYYVTAPEILVGNIDQSIILIEQKIASSRRSFEHQLNSKPLK